MIDVVNQPMELLHRQSAGNPKCCMKPLQSSEAHATSGLPHCHWPIILAVTLAHLLVLHSFPLVFEEKRDCLQSMADPSRMQDVCCQ